MLDCNSNKAFEPNEAVHTDVKPVLFNVCWSICKLPCKWTVLPAVAGFASPLYVNLAEPDIEVPPVAVIILLSTFPSIEIEEPPPPP